MQLVRTTIRLEKQLKKDAETLAIEKETSFQKVVSEAVGEYVAKRKTKKILKNWHFPTADLGVPLDNLTRDEIYGDPEIPC